MDGRGGAGIRYIHGDSPSRGVELANLVQETGFTFFLPMLASKCQCSTQS